MREGKIELDKYYTSYNIAEECYRRVKEVIGLERISEIIEPSAGGGVFLDVVGEGKPIKGYDIEPEDERVERADYIETEIGYKEGRIILGNPPYGERMRLGQQFYKKAVTEGDYVAFILPISQYNSESSLYEFELIESVDLGKQEYSGRKIHCCFNIYKRPKEGLRVKGEQYKLDWLTIKEQRSYRGQKVPKDYKYDIGICSWGSIGKEVKEQGEYTQEMYIRVEQEGIREEVKEIIRVTDWTKVSPSTSSPSLKQWQVRRHIVKELEGRGYKVTKEEVTKEINKN